MTKYSTFHGHVAEHQDDQQETLVLQQCQDGPGSRPGQSAQFQSLTCGETEERRFASTEEPTANQQQRQDQEKNDLERTETIAC